jgi:hypothetical protein
MTLQEIEQKRYELRQAEAQLVYEQEAAEEREREEQRREVEAANYRRKEEARKKAELLEATKTGVCNQFGIPPHLTKLVTGKNFEELEASALEVVRDYAGEIARYEQQTRERLREYARKW